MLKRIRRRVVIGVFLIAKMDVGDASGVKRRLVGAIRPVVRWFIAIVPLSKRDQPQGPNTVEQWLHDRIASRAGGEQFAFPVVAHHIDVYVRGNPIERHRRSPNKLGRTHHAFFLTVEPREDDGVERLVGDGPLGDRQNGGRAGGVVIRPVVHATLLDAEVVIVSRHDDVAIRILRATHDSDEVDTANEWIGSRGRTPSHGWRVQRPASLRLTRWHRARTEFAHTGDASERTLESPGQWLQPDPAKLTHQECARFLPSA